MMLILGVAMSVLIIVYSFTGNNRLLAATLAPRIGATVEEVHPARARWKISILLDLMFKRQPQIAPIAADPAAFDHVLFIAPLWDMSIAAPMAVAIRTLAPQLRSYAFASFCGYDRPGQHDHVLAELNRIVGRPPTHATELMTGRLVPPVDRDKISKVSARRVLPEELVAFTAEIDSIVGWFHQAGALNAHVACD